MITTQDDPAQVTEDSARPAAAEVPTDLVALLAFSALAAMTRLAKDSDQAPEPAYQIDHARMAAQAFREFQLLDGFAQQQGLDLIEGIGQFAGLFDELEDRTRPSSWWERSVKTYVVIGIFADALQDLSDRHELFDGAEVQWDFGQGQWEQDHFAPLAKTDKQLASRLSLWARRVAGEAIALLRAVLFTYPTLAGDGLTADAAVERAVRRHEARMEALNLAA